MKNYRIIVKDTPSELEDYINCILKTNPNIKVSGGIAINHYGNGTCYQVIYEDV